MNYVLIIFLLLILVCCIRGARKGMLSIVYSLIAWVFVIWFISFATTYVENIITVNTNISTQIQNNISDHLHDTYNSSEAEEEGTGDDAILALVPDSFKNSIEETIQTSIDTTIAIISEELTAAAIKGVATIVSVVVAIIIVILVSKLIKLIGLAPGIRGVNRLLGVFAGLIQAMIIIWLSMYIADCFPTSAFGEFILTGVNGDEMLLCIYTHNLIELIVGI